MAVSKDKGQIIINDAYVMLKPKSNVEAHSHKMPHIICGREPFELSVAGKLVRGRTGIIPSDQMHVVVSMAEDTDMLLIMPLTDLYFQINGLVRDKCWVSDKYHSFNQVIEVLAKSRISYKDEIGDERLVGLIDKLEDEELFQKPVTELARYVGLSESRLKHLFSARTGIRLKHYLLLNKLKRAYWQVNRGQSITFAAGEGGFADSSHLAVVSKKLMGISVSDVFRSDI